MLAKKFSAPSDSIVVIGMGRFGGTVAESMMRMGHEVLGIDEDPDVVQHWSDRLTHMVQADTTNIEVLRQLGVQDLRHAVIGIGNDIEASVLTALALEELGVPDIWAKASNERHGRILERTGVHHVVYPEAAMGERVAHLVTGRMIDFIEFDDGFAIAKTGAPAEAYHNTLSESGIRTRHGVTVVGIKRGRLDFIYATAETIIEPGDILVISGPTANIQRFAATT